MSGMYAQTRLRFRILRADVEQRVRALMPEAGSRLIVVDVRDFDVCRFTYGTRDVRMELDPMLAIVAHQFNVIVSDVETAEPRRMRALLNAPAGVAELIVGLLRGEI
jgi:hypothetical protein